MTSKARLAVLASIAAFMLSTFVVALPASSASAAPTAVASSVAIPRTAYLPAVAPPASALPDIGGHWCGFSAYCVDLNRTDQQALRIAGGAAFSITLCYAIKITCPIVGPIVAIAALYLDGHGYCRTHFLWIRYTFFPYPYMNGWCGN